MSNVINIRRSVLLLFILIFLTSCGSDPRPTEHLTQNTVSATLGTKTDLTHAPFSATPRLNTSSTFSTTSKLTTITTSPTPSSLITLTPIQNSDLITPVGRWLKGVPCSAPCWEGITPGITTAQQAIEILKRSPALKNVNIEVPAVAPNIGYITWYWVLNGKEGGDMLYAAKTQTQTIYAIEPYFSLASNFTLNDFIQTYGQPEQVIATYTMPDLNTYSYDLFLVYLSKGFVLYNTGLDNKPTLKLDMPIKGVEIFSSTLDGYNIVYDKTIYKSKLFIKWQGLKDFDYYCRMYDQSTKHCS